ncbi:MAG: hypothetical protein QOG94_3265, partial [Solirubrobacteraceae bacterium]|nr:hypothetical protein [Solirubrobacteraceae bacterium]
MAWVAMTSRESLIRTRGSRIGTEDLHLLAMPAEAVDGPGDGPFPGAPLAVHEEAVVPEPRS